MEEHNGVYKEEKYYSFLPDYKKFKTHFIRKRHTKVCPVFYMKRTNDLRRLGLPLTDTQKRKGITNMPPGSLYDSKELPTKRKEYSSFVLIAFKPWRNLGSFNLVDDNGWWESFLRSRNIGEFPKRTLSCIANLQEWNETFLNPHTGDYLGADLDNSEDDEVSDVDDNKDWRMSLKTNRDFLEDEANAKPTKIIKVNNLHNPKTVEKGLLKQLREIDFKFVQENIPEFPELNNLNSAADYKTVIRNTEDIENDPNLENSDATNFDPRDIPKTKVYFLCLEKAHKGIRTYKPRRSRVLDVAEYTIPNPSIVDLALHHGLSKKQFLPYAVLAQKMMLRMLEQVKENILSRKQLNLKLSLNKLFKNEPLRAVLIGPAGTGKSRTLNCYFHWMKLWGLKKHIITSAPTGVAALLLREYLMANTFYKSLGINVNRLNDTKPNARLQAVFEHVWVFVLDEVSMVSAGHLNRIDERIRFLTGNKELYMGGLDIFVTGDFSQLPPTKGTALYSKSHLTITTEKDEYIHKGSRDYFECFAFFFTLVKVFRSDPEFTKVLTNFRICKPTKKNIASVNKRLVGKNLACAPNPTAICPTNNMRTTVNDECFWTFVKVKNITELKHDFGFYGYINITGVVTTKTEKILTHEAEAGIHAYVRNMREDSLGKMAGNLKVYIGCPIMVIQNIDVDVGKCNGTFATLAKIIFKKKSLINYDFLENGVVIPSTPASNISKLILSHNDMACKNIETITNLPGFFEVERKTASLAVDWDSNFKGVQTQMSQFPIVTAFAITGHKTQGATLKNILICSFKGHSSGKSGWLYVVLSRVKSLKNIFILEKLPTDLSHYKSRPKVKIELDRIKTNSVQTSAFIKRIWRENPRLFGNR